MHPQSLYYPTCLGFVNEIELAAEADRELGKSYLRDKQDSCGEGELWHEMQRKWNFFISRSSAVEKAEDITEVGRIFEGLAESWRESTGGYSLTYRRYAHPSYQAILVLGKDSIPFILRELQQRPDLWFEALRLLTKENPAQNAKSFNDAVSCWLRWGKQNRFIS